MKKVFTAAALLACLNAGASDWKAVSGNSEVQVLVDAQSVAISGSLRKAWFTYTYETAQKTNSYPEKTYFSYKLLSYYNCREKTTASSYIVYYSEQFAAGMTVETTSVAKEKMSFVDVVPDSIGEANMNYVCSYPLPAPKQKISDYLDAPRKGK